MSRQHYATLLRDTSRCGVYSAPRQVMDELLAAAEASGFATFRIDLATVLDKEGLFERLATALEFPNWFGRNWDALADCLGDLSWMEAKGYVILLEHSDDFRSSNSADFTTALQVFESAAEVWRDEGVPFWVLVEINPEGGGYLPVIE